MGKDATRSKYVFVKTQLDPKEILVPALREHSHDWAIVWAKHEDDPKNVHFHAVIRFASTESWAWLRADLMNKDEHSYSAAARGWQRCVRYLLHLDSPDKPPIPRENLSWAGEISDDEISMLLGRPRAYLLHDLRSAPFHDTFRLVDWLVNERGHGPGEVTAMLNCIMAANKFLGPIASLDGNPTIAAGEESGFDLPCSPLGEPAIEADFDDGSLGGLPDDLFD